MKYNNMLPDVRRGLDSAAMASRVILGGVVRKNAPKAEHERAWERITRYCVRDSVTASAGPRARHAMLQRVFQTPMAPFRTARSEKKKATIHWHL